jgi:hypothetical protein
MPWSGNSFSIINTAVSGTTILASQYNQNLSDIATGLTELADGTKTPSFAAINFGATTDTTLARSSAGNLSIEGNVVYRAGGTDVALADGGTGLSPASLQDLARSILDALGSEVKGSLIYHNGSAWVLLAPP